jgi:hypothetical protein
MSKVDLAISLIPYTFHAQVIKSAIRTKKHVVTTSYVSPAMMELDQQCKDAGITVMNEIGLDPVGALPMFCENPWLIFISPRVSITFTRLRLSPRYDFSNRVVLLENANGFR